MSCLFKVHMVMFEVYIFYAFIGSDFLWGQGIKCLFCLGESMCLHINYFTIKQYMCKIVPSTGLYERNINVSRESLHVV